MLEELKKNPSFRKKYFEVLKYRLSYGSLEIEGIDEDLAEVNQSVKIFNMLQALDYITENINEEKLGHYDFTNLLCNLVSRVTNGEITNFRTTNVVINGSNVKRTPPTMIRNDLWYLIDDYNYRSSICESDDERFAIEAWFHIKLLHIHPFEDGNGRTARILLASNLMKSGLAPVIITNKTKREYCDMIENSDETGLKNMFRDLSKKENITMNAIYNDLKENVK